MATPTKSHTVSTPKHHLSTPSKLMASPRPGTSGNSSRPLAYKSPAVKTPASGHTHHVSVSSQPSSTPLAAHAVHDDLLALTSPAAALINSLGPTGLTPLGSAGDGLGITTSISGGPVRSAAALNPEAERLHRAQLVVDTLQSRVGGHGITREGVERIAQLQGFTTLWDDDNLTIAGNCVDLEVNFEAGNRNNVRDVSLKLNISDNATESEEPQLQEQGTKVIKNNLQTLSTVNGNAQWRNLDAFASNLQYLSQLDRIETGTPCFNAVGDLFNTFQTIWNAEKARFKGRTAWQQLRQSAVGRPVMDRQPKLGLALDYWAARKKLDLVPEGLTEDTIDEAAEVYTAQLSCEAGLPSTAIVKNWVSDRVLIEDPNAMLDANTERLRPDWREAAQASEDVLLKPDTDEAVDKPPDTSPSILDLHFCCALLPEVYLPLNVAANLNVETVMLDISQDSTMTYQAALHKDSHARDASGVQSTAAERWLRSLPVSVGANPDRLRKHSYALHSTQNAPPLWCYPVKHLNFVHPRQLAGVLPILRQYALLWRILRSLVKYADADHSKTLNHTRSNNNQISGLPARPLKRTNKKTASSRIDDLLRSTGTLTTDEALPIDFTLDVLSDATKARLDVYIPTRKISKREQRGPFIFLALCICRDGAVEVHELRGIPHSADDGSNIRSKLVRILEATEDLGLMVEWLLKQASAAA